MTRTVRPRRSVADESGGEEILYPRQPHGPDLLHPFDRVNPSSPEPPSPIVPPLPTEQSLLSDVSSSPPSSFTPLTPLRKAKKRTSDEFEMDNSGLLVSKRSSVSTKDRGQPVSKEEKPSSLRKHRSTASTASTSSARDRARERRRESSSASASAKPSSVAPSTESTPIAIPPRVDRERYTHSRQLSAGDSSSGPDPISVAHPRRVHTTDFSHLPPSPSTTSIHQFLKHAGSGTTPPHRPSSSSNKESSHSHASPNVAHSLLRGTQEGWSSMDDDAHAEALRKLDGLSGKTARARASVGSLNRVSVSRPGTPGSTTGRSGVHWDGVSNETGKVSRRGSAKEKERKEEPRPPTSGLGISGSSGDVVTQDVHEARMGSITSGDEHHSSSGAEKPSKKHTSIGARLSFTPKRGSASSTTYTSTPTSSRDSTSLSTATSATSVSAPSGSGRHSTGVGKGRRNSAGSDISSVYSGGDGALYKDRTGSLAASAEALEEDRVPPEPPLPKDLSNYRSPPSSHGITFPPSAANDSEVDRTVSLEVPSASKPPTHHHDSLNQGSQSAPESAPPVTKTPSKKWSFSNALNIKLTSSPSISSMKEKDHSLSNSKTASFPLSPRSMQSFSQQLRKSASREHALSPPVVSSTSWSPVQPDAMASAASLASLSSVGSTRGAKSPAILSAKTPDRERGFPSRPGTGSSGSNNTTGLSAPPNAPLSPASSIRRQQSKRLTPSSIPFFRRSSSQSIHIPPPNTVPASTSPTMPLAPGSTQNSRRTGGSPVKDPPRTAPTTPGSHKKSSVLSLGLPSLLKSSSRRSLHGDKSDAGTGKETRDGLRSRDPEKEKSKQDPKDRSESRISVLMGRKRGKVSGKRGHREELTNGVGQDVIIYRGEKDQCCCDVTTHADDRTSRHDCTACR